MARRFSPTRLLNGQPVETREGRGAIFVCLLADKHIPARLVMSVDSGLTNDETSFQMVNYFMDGSFLGACPSEMDLVMQDMYADDDPDYEPIDLRDSDEWDDDEELHDESYVEYVDRVRNHWISGRPPLTEKELSELAKNNPDMVRLFKQADQVASNMKKVAS